MHILDLPSPDSPAGVGNDALRVVGIGASAGGLAAFEAFFRSVPTDAEAGMAYVLVQHLSPDHKSILAELVQRYTSMPVAEVRHGVAVQPNRVYVMPPGRDMRYLDGRLLLREPRQAPGRHLPIDGFFRSLARELGSRAVGIVLSGTGSDGSMGVRAIKDAGGLVIVQSPHSASFDGMPLSTRATGVVDIELPPEQMPHALFTLARQRLGKRWLPLAIQGGWSDATYASILELLRTQTGHDFSQYKVGTVRRRIERRMAVHRLDSLQAYADHLHATPAEVRNLFFDLPIGVTAFFRDPEAFEALETDVLPRLLAGKDLAGTVRIWSVGCSTGEEPYSIGMLVLEALWRMGRAQRVQVFATDLDHRAISVARAGLYPASVASELRAERLARFFTREMEGNAYRVSKALRDIMVFSEHDVIRDPPFSRIDLIVCRNLLIYFEADLQKRVIPLLHYALSPGGILFLGPSESVGENGELFSVRDRRAKLFARREPGRPTRLNYPASAAQPVAIKDPSPHHPTSEDKRPPPMKTSLREITEQALLRMAPASALVTAQGDIRYLHGRTGMYLEPAPGEAGVNNILRMAREGLRPVLEAALQAAVARQESTFVPRVQVRSNGHFVQVSLSIRLVPGAGGDGSGAPLYLVVLEESSALRMGPAPAEPLSADAEGDPSTPEASVLELRQELQARDEHIRTLSEALERSEEALKSSNEEMQAVNEELQATNEELETSKEELQAVNEELTTVNTELQVKVTDLSRANNDMNNLLAGTGIGTVFVDHDLRVLRFTPATASIIHLIPSDVGRPIAHIASNLVGYDNLIADLRGVLDTLENIQREVQTSQHRWYTMRIQPYRTLEHVIEGAVITFVDMTDVRMAQDALRRASGLSRVAAMLRDASDAMVIQDLDGRILAWNDAARRQYGWDEAEALALPALARIPAELRRGCDELVNALRAADAVVAPFESRRLRQSGDSLEVWVTVTALRDESGRLRALAMTEQPAAQAARTALG